MLTIAATGAPPAPGLSGAPDAVSTGRRSQLLLLLPQPLKLVLGQIGIKPQVRGHLLRRVEADSLGPGARLGGRPRAAWLERDGLRDAVPFRRPCREHVADAVGDSEGEQPREKQGYTNGSNRRATNDHAKCQHCSPPRGMVSAREYGSPRRRSSLDFHSLVTGAGRDGIDTQDAQANGQGRGLRPISRAQLLVDARRVVLDRVDRKEEALGRFPIALALGDQPENLDLGGQPRLPLC